MARFSIGGEDDSEGYDARPPQRKRPRAAPSSSQHSTHSSLKVDREEISKILEFDSQEELDAEEEDELEEEEEEEESDSGGQGLPSRDSASTSRDGSVSFTLADPDVFDCPICCEPLVHPVFQCENGHLACFPCCRKLRHKCPSCLLPIGYNRCRAIEKVIESVMVSCCNKLHGCKDQMTYNKKHEHEQRCLFTPFSCPVPQCNYVGLFDCLYTHFTTGHSGSVKCFCYNHPFNISFAKEESFVILKEKGCEVIFILACDLGGLGRMVSFSHVAHSGIPKGYSCELVAKKRQNTLKMQSVIGGGGRSLLTDVRGENCLLVPCSFLHEQEKLELQICISKAEEAGARR